MKHVWIGMLAAVLCSACRIDGRIDEEIVLQEKTQAKVSEILEDYTIVPLETTEENLVLDATLLRICHDKVYILDCFAPEKNLYVFRLDGTYIGKAGRMGNGPGEFVMPGQLVVDEANRQLLVYDMATNKLIAYHADSLTFTGEYTLPFQAGCVELLDNERLIWYVNAGTRNKGEFVKHIQITDMQGKPLSSHIPPMEFPNRGLYNVMSYFTRDNSHTYFHHPFLGEYYACSANDSVLQRAFALRFEKLPFPTAEYVAAHKNSIVKDLEADRYIQWCNVYLAPQVLLCYAGSGKDIYWGVYDRQREAGWYIRRDLIEDDLGIGRLSRPKTVYKGRFVNTVSMEEEFPEHSILHRYVKPGSKNGNPFLLLYRCKTI